MSQIHPVQSLLDEHRVIEGVLNALEARLLHVHEPPLPTEWLADALDFFRRFVEGCHHNREEELVFPPLRATGLLKEHQAGAAYLDKLAAALEVARGGDPKAAERLRREGMAYVRFLRDHINREDEVLHRVASQPAVEEEILRLQERASPEHFHGMDEDTYERYLTLAERLSAAPVV